MNRRVYLDHNATAPLLAESLEAMRLALQEGGGWGNPSSPHGVGHAARLSLEASRRDVAALIGAAAREVVFVSGGTESDNLAVQGCARAWTASGRGPGHLVASAVEHPAVLQSCRHLEATGWRLTILPVDGSGRVRPDDLRAALRPDTALVSIMAANNETGVLQPLEAIAPVTREAGVPLHVDAVQAAGRVPIDVASLGADFVSFSAHKMGGPAGLGALWVRDGAPIAPLLAGGGQERRLRPGTEPVALAAGFAAAARACAGGAAGPGVRALRDRLESDLKQRLSGLRVNAETAPRLPNTSSLMLAGARSEDLVIAMDLEGFAISTGSACSTGSARPSHVLAAMGLTSDQAAGTIRVSLGPSNTEEDIDAFTRALRRVAAASARAAAVGR